MTQTSNTEQLVRLSQRARIVEQITGERPHVATIHRWAQRGLKGIRLRTAFAGGHRRTSDRWVREFFQEVTKAAGADSRSAMSQASARSRDCRLRHADATLDRDGF